MGGVVCLGDCSGSAVMTGSAARTGSGASASSGAGTGSGGGEGGGGGGVEEVGVVVSGARPGGGVYHSGWGVEGRGEEGGDGVCGEGDGGVVSMVSGEMKREESRSSSLYLSNSNSQRRFRVFFTGGSAVGDSV